MTEVSDEELLAVIKDFLDMGHVENIVAMFRREPAYLRWTGRILEDERLSVRLGVSVLFEELTALETDHLDLAAASLVPLLDAKQPLLRGEALSVLAIIDGPDLHGHADRLSADPNPQVRELAADILASFDRR